MARHANFQVDPRLTKLLGETCHSSEQAIKELVDNAWDADASHVWINLPAPMTFDPIIVRDDGMGMKEWQVRNEYLRIARDRRAKEGDYTYQHHRIVKGRKGIGKFAGMMIANHMIVETRAQGQTTTLTIPKDELLQAAADLERLPLTIEARPCASDEHGTQITLSGLHEQRTFPDPERLKQLLVMEYRREDGFTIFVNGIPLSIEDVPGTPCAIDATLPDVGSVRLRLRITEDPKATKHSGIAIRVAGKIIGKPSYFGLDLDDNIPPKLLRRVYGEVEADGLVDDLTADGAFIFENSKAYAAVEAFFQTTVRAQLDEAFRNEMNLAKGRVKQEIDRRLSQLPEYRREFASREIERTMKRFYGLPEERLEPIISVVLDALERDEYWQVLERINAARDGDVGILAEALHEFGVLELGLIAQHARYRLRVLDELEALIAKAETLEAIVHTAVATNLWIFGPDFALMSSNRTLASILEQYADEHFTGERAAKRPDLLLVSRFGERYVLIEFKRPGYSIGRQDLSQAEQYRDDLISRFHPMDVMVIGKDVDPTIMLHLPPAVTPASYLHLINRARQELTWLLQELTTDKSRTPS